MKHRLFDKSSIIKMMAFNFKSMGLALFVQALIMLSLLYTIRIIAGGVAIDITLSVWLLSFSIFIFLSLAMVKRYTEILKLSGASNQNQNFNKKLFGRAYTAKDLNILSILGINFGIASVIIFLLYIHSEEVQKFYSQPNFLYLTGLTIVYWIGRIWFLANDGQLDDDPIVFAVKDRISWITFILIGLLFLMAIFL